MQLRRESGLNPDLLSPTASDRTSYIKRLKQRMDDGEILNVFPPWDSGRKLVIESWRESTAHGDNAYQNIFCSNLAPSKQG